MKKFLFSWHPRRGRQGLRSALPLAAVVGLSGCAAPINPISVVSTIIDGTSYVTTGKSSTDHVVSGVMEEDCALHRALAEEDVCKPEDPDKKQIQAIARTFVPNDAEGDRD